MSIAAATLGFAITGLLGLLIGVPAAAQTTDRGDGLTDLLAVYATQPQGYPNGKEYARPDTREPFRWHFYHSGAIQQFDHAPMVGHVDSYNSLEERGVRTDRAGAVKWQFVSEHVTEGRHALQVDFPADAIKAGKAAIAIEGIAGAPTFSQYLRARGLLAAAVCYGPHYRWIKLDAFNPSPGSIRVRVSGVPLVLHSGRNVIAVKTADAVARHYQCLFNSIPVEVIGPVENVRLFLDNVRMEQELPATIARKGKLFQFPGRASAQDPPVVAPGFTAVEADTHYTPERGFGWTEAPTTRSTRGHSFRSNEHGILWGYCLNCDSPLRVDLPRGRYGICAIGAPTGSGFQWSKGLTVRINGHDHNLLKPRDADEVRRVALGGEAWDFRPGACVWEALMREPYYPPMSMVYDEADEGQLLIEFPATLALHALLIFPEAEKDAAIAEIGRLNFLLAESWDVSHSWVKGDYARQAADGHSYIGVHNEMVHPETVPERLRALNLTPADWRRGVVFFHRGLTEPVYSDTIPAPAEAAVRELRCFAAPDQRVCTTLGLLPLTQVTGLKISAGDLVADNDQGRIAADAIDVRISREHQKTMQFGHHNHDYNYQEHYLVRRPRLDLFPGAARRAYFDISVPADVAPGEYAGVITVSGEDGRALATIPLHVEVASIQLEDAPVYFAGSCPDPRLKNYGFNALAASYDQAVEHGYAAYLANLGHVAKPFKSKPIGWNNFLANQDLLAPLIDAGNAGRGPRGFFGGPVPSAYGNPKADAVTREFFDDVRKAIPAIDLLGRTAPAFYHGGYTGFADPHEWIILAARARPHTPEALESARASGDEFWFIDGLRHSKEQAGRFTFGLWFWRLGAKGRFTTLEAHLQYGGGTARSTYVHEPYFTLMDVTTCNVDRAVKESLIEGQWNPCRDLILLREGIDDYRTLHTLDVWIARAESKKCDGDALTAARQFRDNLRQEISLDLTRYYEARAGSYGENWYALPDNPWTTEKFDRVRRNAVAHITSLRKAIEEKDPP